MEDMTMTMIKKSFYAILSIAAAAFMTAACQSVELDTTPEEEETEIVPERTTIPFSLVVNTEETKVDYSGGTYAFKTGDYLHVVGTTRTDLEGDLTRNGDVWSGELSYETANGDPDTDEALTVTLVHADNDDVSSYASAVVGSAPVGSTLLREAVEKYSLLTAATTLNASSATLYQQAAFLDVTVTLDFDGSREVQAGQALVDLITHNGVYDGEDMEPVQLQALANNEDFSAHFLAVVPGGHKVSDFTLTIVDRAITFSDKDLVLQRNKKYTVNRTIVFGPQLGDPFWSDGTYGRMQHADPNAYIVGIIVYVNHQYTEGTEEAAIDDAITEKSANYGHGLVMALHNVAGSGDLWGTGANAGGARWCLDTGIKEGELRTGVRVTKPSETLGISALNGLANTNAIITALGANSAASLAKNYPITVSTDHTSGWFLPSLGQWIYTISIDGFGGADHASQWVNNQANPVNWLKKGSLSDLIRVMDNNGSTENLLVKSLNDRLEDLKTHFAPDDPNFYDAFGWSVGSDYGDNYWTSTEYDASNAFRMNLGSVETDGSGNKYSTIKVKQELKSNYYTWKSGFILRVRPFLAF